MPQIPDQPPGYVENLLRQLLIRRATTPAAGYSVRPSPPVPTPSGPGEAPATDEDAYLRQPGAIRPTAEGEARRLSRNLVIDPHQEQGLSGPMVGAFAAGLEEGARSGPRQPGYYPDEARYRPNEAADRLRAQYPGMSAREALDLALKMRSFR